MNKQEAIEKIKNIETLNINDRVAGQQVDMVIKNNEFLKDELYNRAYKDIERQEIEIETLKDKCVDLMH